MDIEIGSCTIYAQTVDGNLRQKPALGRFGVGGVGRAGVA